VEQASNKAVRDEKKAKKVRVTAQSIVLMYSVPRYMDSLTYSVRTASSGIQYRGLPSGGVDVRLPPTTVDLNRYWLLPGCLLDV
jgi:hypothetical protein